MSERISIEWNRFQKSLELIESQRFDQVLVEPGFFASTAISLLAPTAQGHESDVPQGRSRMLRHTSYPFSLGIPMSRKTTSGRNDAARLRASIPSSAAIIVSDQDPVGIHEVPSFFRLWSGWISTETFPEASGSKKGGARGPAACAASLEPGTAKRSGLSPNAARPGVR
jgi:hypothetical protein